MEKPDPESVSGGTLLSTRFDGKPNIGHDPGWRLPWMTAADQGAAGPITMHQIDPAGLHPIARRTGVGQSTGGKSLMANGMDPAFLQQLQQLFAHAPGQVAIKSGWRSTEEQQALHDRAEQQHPGEANRWAAQPGTSWHEFGQAADLAFADPNVLAWAHEHAAEYGLFFPMPWEPWHIQPLWTQGRKPSPQSPPTGGTTIPPDGMDAGQQQDSSNADPLGRIFGTFRSMMQSPTEVDAQHPVQDDFLTIGERWHSFLHPTTAPSSDQGGLGGGLAALAGGSGGNQTPAGGSIDYRKAYQYVIDAGGTPEEAGLLAALAGPESGYQVGVVSPVNDDGTYDRGLFQINDVHQKDQNRLVTDPVYNAQVALEILRSQGPTAWTAYKDGAYRDYLPGGEKSKAS